MAEGVDVLGFGLGVSQAAHLSTSSLFCIKQVEHSKLPAGFLNSPVKLSPVGCNIRQDDSYPMSTDAGTHF